MPLDNSTRRGPKKRSHPRNWSDAYKVLEVVDAWELVNIKYTIAQLAAEAKTSRQVVTGALKRYRPHLLQPVRP